MASLVLFYFLECEPQQSGCVSDNTSEANAKVANATSICRHSTRWPIVLVSADLVRIGQTFAW